MCVCPVVMVSLFFSQEEEHQKILKWQKRKKRHWPVAQKSMGQGGGVVSKTHIFSLNLLPLSGTVWLYGDNHSICPLPCSNYDKEYHKWQLFVPTDSSPDPEEHPYRPKDPWALTS